jgi:putative intracellular protease/amidase/methionine-rich copper-binding protein CopC
MWGYIPDFNIVMIAEEAGPVMSTQGVATVAEYSFADAPELDIVMVPGGVGTLVQLENKRFIDYLVKVNENTEFTISVCTGSALLAKAGLLRGHRATANKRAFSLSSDQDKEVDWVVEARWVESGKFFTSSGVSAGTDMALGLISSIYGKHAADSLASSVEYEWHDDPTVDPFAQFVPQSALNSLELTFVDTGQGELVEAEPSPDSTLTRSPEYIHLYFDTRPDASLSAVSLDRIGEEGNSVSLSQMHTMGNNDLMIRVDDALPDGEYILEWNARFANKVIETTGGYSFVVQSSEL